MANSCMICGFKPIEDGDDICEPCFMVCLYELADEEERRQVTSQKNTRVAPGHNTSP